MREIKREKERETEIMKETARQIQRGARRFRQITAVKELIKANEIETGVNRKAGGEDDSRAVPISLFADYTDNLPSGIDDSNSRYRLCGRL